MELEGDLSQRMALEIAFEDSFSNDPRGHVSSWSLDRGLAYLIGQLRT